MSHLDFRNVFYMYDMHIDFNNNITSWFTKLMILGDSML